MALVLDGTGQCGWLPKVWSGGASYSFGVKYKVYAFDHGGLLCLADPMGTNYIWLYPDVYAGALIGLAEAGEAGTEAPYATGGSVVTGEWRSAVLTYNHATLDLILYQDDAAPVTVSTDAFPTGTPFDGKVWIGLGPTESLTGKLAVVRIWERALSAGEAAAYNAAVSIDAVNAISGGVGADLISGPVTTNAEMSVTLVGGTLPVFDADTPLTVTDPSVIRSGSTFTVTHALGELTTATLGGNAVAITFSETGVAILTDTSGLTTSGTYDLVIGDGVSTETQGKDLVVVGLPAYTLNKGGAALGDLAGVNCVVAATDTLGGGVLYSASDLTATAGTLDSNIYLDTGNVGDAVTVSVLTAANEGISFETTLQAL